MIKRSKELNKNINTKLRKKKPIRVIYKKVGQMPIIKVIQDVNILKRKIVKDNLDIIPYENLYIICNNKDKNRLMRTNIYLPFNRISGDLIVVEIDKEKREFKGIKQEDILWYTKDLINKEPLKKIEGSKNMKINVSAINERDINDNRYFLPNYENTLEEILNKLNILLSKILSKKGEM